MFEPGTKVILAESSLHKTIGPRKGSIGYVSNCSFTRAITTITEGFGSFNVVASLCEIVFIRFGFEEHGRMERKSVISVFPIIKNGRLLNSDNKKEINSEIPKQIKDLCRMISTQRDFHLWENVRDVCEVSSNVPVALVIPLNYDITDLTTCNDLEFKAWITSYLNSISLIKFINNTGQSLHYTNYNDVELNKSETWDYLYRLVNDREFRADCIRQYSGGIEEKKKGILLMRRIISALSRAKLKKIRRIVEDTRHMISNDFTLAFYDTVGPYLHNKVAMLLFDKMLRHFAESETARISDDLSSVMTECFSISNSMLRSNNGFGYTSLNSK